MDNSAAEQYLTKLFGTRQGYVSVAYKVPQEDNKGEWKESQFEWPKQKAALLKWASAHTKHNVFICPALRKDPHVRKKGDMQPTHWLWADVDWQFIPENRKAEIIKRVNEVGTLTIRSGSGENTHVYVKLTNPVSADEFAKLNTGLRDYLLADNKQADNSFLRLPGTTNWKTAEGVVVRSTGGNNKAWSVDSLMAKRAFRDAKVTDDAGAIDWEFVQVEGLTRRMRDRIAMTVGEALGRYSKRHKAVFAVTKDLHRWGLGSDEIHSLMHEFPPAQSKAGEENGYDVHTDVDRCLTRIRQIEDVAPDLTDEEQEEIGEALTELDEGEFRTERVNEIAQSIRDRNAAVEMVKAEEARSRHTKPPAEYSESLDDALSMPPEPVQYLIDGLCSASGTVVISGQYKTGKTHLMVASLITSLADNQPFLGTHHVHVPDGGAIVGHWNLEMSRLDLIDKYMRPAEFKNPGNVKLAHWQGIPFSLLTEPGKRDAIEWLTERAVQVWTIDSWSALCRMARVDPNDNRDVGALVESITEVKRSANVQAVFMLAHIARASSESDRPGTKGASELDQAVDTRWMLTVDKSEVRYLTAEGRGTSLSPTSLEFDEVTGRSKSGATRQSAAAFGGAQMVASALQSMNGGGLNKTALIKKLREIQPGLGQRKAAEYIEEALTADLIEIREEHGRGAPSLVHYLTADTAPSGDRHRNATPSVVDLSGVRSSGRRKRPG